MDYLLYPMDHQTRGVALANANPGMLHGLFNHVGHVPLKHKGLTTLAFWGHGDPFGFCGMSPQEMAKILSKWKSANPDLKTVEVITCNARHGTGAEPFITALKAAMRSGFMNNCSKIKVKAMPLSIAGESNVWSILLADTISWAYITAPGKDDSLMMSVNNMIRYEPIPGDPKGGIRSFNGNISERADQVARENKVRNWTLNYGPLSTLRKNLVEV
jgi:hypothetical protein